MTIRTHAVPSGPNSMAAWRHFCLHAGLALLLLLFAGSASAQARAWLDRSTVGMGESVTLNVEGGSNEEPDFSVLESDFRIVRRSSVSQMNIVNGAMARTNLWAVGLEPLHEGVITIPALVVGKQLTEPLTLTVRPMQRGSAADGDDVFLEVEADTQSPYVQQQVGYRVRLYYAVSLLEGNLDEPAGDGVQVRRIGQDANYSRQIDGRRYNVVERRYALTPERSGSLQVRGVTFRGRVARGAQYNSFFSQGVPLTIGSEDIELEVRPAPANAPSPWLPAQQLTLRDDAQRLPAQVSVGDALELTLVAEATGLSAEQMPELSLPPIEGAEVYPDQEVRETTESDGRIVGKRSRRFAIVPLRAGPLELPERSLTWWNIGSDQSERSTLPARTLEVLPAAGAATPSAPSSPVDGSAQQYPAEVQADPAQLRLWRGLAISLAMAWLLTLLAWWRWPRRRDDTPPEQDAADEKRLSWRPELAHALAHDDLAAAGSALLRMRPQLRDLGSLAAALADDEQRDAVLALERALYRGDVREGLAERLRAAFAKRPAFVAENTAASATEQGLPPLYPSARG